MAVNYISCKTAMQFTYLQRVEKVKIHALILICKLRLLYIILWVQRSGQKWCTNNGASWASFFVCASHFDFVCDDWSLNRHKATQILFGQIMKFNSATYIASHSKKRVRCRNVPSSFSSCILEGMCTSPQMIPGPQMIPDRKWSPNWTANDPWPQVILILDRKWSRPKTKEWHGLILKWHTKNIFIFYKKYSILVIFLFLFFFFWWKICDIAWLSVLFISGPFAFYSNWFRKSTCSVEHPRTSENMRNRILFLYMNNASAVHVWFQWKSGREYKTHIPMKSN